MERSRLVAIMFTDLVGSVSLKERLGAVPYSRLIARHDEIFRQIVAEVRAPAPSNAAGDSLAAWDSDKDTGDGFMALFATSSEAVTAALRFQYAIAHEPWESETPEVRIGIHSGEVTMMGKDIAGRDKVIGKAADLAARVMGLAAGGQILVTRPVYDSAHQYIREHPPIAGEDEQPALNWVTHPPRSVKGENDPIEIFEVGTQVAAPPRTARGSSRWMAAGALFGVAVLAIVFILMSQRGVEDAPDKPAAPALSKDILALPAGPVLETLLHDDLPAQANQDKPQLRLTLLARRQGEAAFQPLNDGAKLASQVDDYILAAQAFTAGHLYVFQVDSVGRVTWFFPKNESSLSAGTNPVAGGQVILIPPRRQDGKSEALYLDDQTGYEHIYAVFAADPWANLEASLTKAIASSPDVTLASAAPLRGMNGPLVLPGEESARIHTRGVGGKRIAEPDRSTIYEDVELESGKYRLPIIGDRFEANGAMLVIERWFEHTR